MANHRAPDNYVPLKTATVVIWFFGLLAALTFGLHYGDKFSVHPHPLFGPFPIAQVPLVPEWLGGTTADVEPPAEEVVTTPEPVVTAISTPAAPAPAPSRAAVVRSAPEPVRTAEVVETSDIQRVVNTPEATKPVVTKPEVIVEDPEPVISEPETIVKEEVVDPVIEEEVFDPIVEEVQPQLPEEVIGRQIDGPEGQVCSVIDVEGNTSCVIPETEELAAEQ